MKFYIYNINPFYKSYFYNKVISIPGEITGLGYCLAVVRRTKRLFLISTKDFSFRAYNRNHARPTVFKLIKVVELKRRVTKKSKNPNHSLMGEEGNQGIIRYFANQLYSEVQFL